jgi:hypothetical protein
MSMGVESEVLGDLKQSSHFTDAPPIGGSTKGFSRWDTIWIAFVLRKARDKDSEPEDLTTTMTICNGRFLATLTKSCSRYAELL